MHSSLHLTSEPSRSTPEVLVRTAAARLAISDSVEMSGCGSRGKGERRKGTYQWIFMAQGSGGSRENSPAYTRDIILFVKRGIRPMFLKLHKR